MLAKTKLRKRLENQIFGKFKSDTNQEGIELDFEYCEKSACAFQYFQSYDGLATLVGKTLFHRDRK